MRRVTFGGNSELYLVFKSQSPELESLIDLAFHSGMVGTCRTDSTLTSLGREAGKDQVHL